MVIKNFNSLAVTPLRKQALLIAEAGLGAVNSGRLVEQYVSYDVSGQTLTVRGQVFSLSPFNRVIVVGFGKAALQAVSVLHQELGNRVSCGFVIDVVEGELENVACRVGTHPYPTLVNVAATRELVSLVKGCTEEDLVITAVSGGGDILLCAPTEMTCEQERDIVSALIRKGATATELRTVRKHISTVKGGQLAKACYPATVISLIFSDVPGDDPALAAGGPTVRDTTTAHEAADILKKYDVLASCRLPSCSLVETPKEDKYFARVHNLLFASTDYALAAMQGKAEDLGFAARIWHAAYQGLPGELGPQIIHDVRKGECLLGAGETPGRNEAIALSVLTNMDEVNDDQVLVTVASGRHRYIGCGGAIADNVTRRQARLQHLNPQEFLDNNDSAAFFQDADNALETGMAGTNVADFFVCLKV